MPLVGLLVYTFIDLSRITLIAEVNTILKEINCEKIICSYLCSKYWTTHNFDLLLKV